MKSRLVSLIAGLFLTGSSAAEVKVLPGTTLTVPAGTTLASSSGLSIGSGGTLRLAGMLDADGDVTVNGALLPTGSGRLLLSGSAAQQLGGSAAISIPVLQLNNGAGLTLAAPVTITDRLELTSGNLNAPGANAVSFDTAALSPAESTGSRIIGTAVMNSRRTGTAALARFLGVDLTAGEDLGNLTITRVTGPAGIVTSAGHTSISASWTLQTTVPTAGNRDLTVAWLSADDNGKNMGAVQLWASAAPYTPYNRVGTGTRNVTGSDPRTFTQNGVPDLNRRFTVTDAASPLPLRLLQLDAAANGREVLVRWTLTDAAGLKACVLQRSFDGAVFDDLCVLPPVAPPSHTYQYRDTTATGSGYRQAYYRLALTGTDGSASLSGVRAVRLEYAGPVAEASPNPFSAIIQLRRCGDAAVDAWLYTPAGQLVRAFPRRQPVAGTVLLDGLSDLGAGVYMLKLRQGDQYRCLVLRK